MLATLALILQGCQQGPDPRHQDATTGRWFTQAQVDQGQRIYQDNCAQCHGGRAQGDPNWKRPDAQGFYPPPPLNGSAHSWHHPLGQLQQTIAEGTGGKMPGWEGQLSEAQILATIAWFQSLWPEKVYRIWQQRQH